MNPSSIPGLTKQKHSIIKAVVGLALLLVVYAAAQVGFDITGNIQNMYKPVPPGHYRVLGVADGDTFDVSMDGVKEEVRLVGVDTPETHHPSKPQQCFGAEASDYTKSLIEGQSVRLQTDTKQPNRDKYSRLLRYAYLEDGRELNELLVSEGYALATNFNTEKKVTLKNLQNAAKLQRKGLWDKCEVTSKNGVLQTNSL